MGSFVGGRRIVGPKIAPELRPLLIQRVVQLRSDNYSFPEIAEEIGYSVDTARNLYNESGAPRIQRAAKAAATPRPPYDPTANHRECPACTLYVSVVRNVIEDHDLLEPLRPVRPGEGERAPKLQQCPATGCKYNELKAALDARKQRRAA